jgi:hypothetical protein
VVVILVYGWSHLYHPAEEQSLSDMISGTVVTGGFLTQLNGAIVNTPVFYTSHTDFA